MSHEQEKNQRANHICGGQRLKIVSGRCAIRSHQFCVGALRKKRPAACEHKQNQNNNIALGGAVLAARGVRGLKSDGRLKERMHSP
jgi:hypothetical protein